MASWEDSVKGDQPEWTVQLAFLEFMPLALVVVILGLFLFGTSRVGEFLEKGFTFISIGNDLHHVLTQAGAYVKDMEGIAKEKGKDWTRRPTALF